MDVISAYLFIEVGFGKLQRVEQCVGGGELDVVAGLLLPHALDDGRQDLIGALLELLRLLHRGSSQSQRGG